MPRTNRINQTAAERNLAILGYLNKVGTWANRETIRTGISGATLPRDRLGKLLDDFIELKLVEKRESDDPRSEHEYRISTDGRDIYYKCHNYDPRIKFVFGLRQKESE